MALLKSWLEQEWFISGVGALGYGSASLVMVCLNHVVLDDMEFPSTTFILFTQVVATFLLSVIARMLSGSFLERRLQQQLSELAKRTAPKMALLFILDVALGHAATRWLGLDAFATLRRACIPIAAHLEPRVLPVVAVSSWSMLFGPLMAMALGRDRHRSFDSTSLRGVVAALASAAVVAARVVYLKNVLNRSSEIARNDVADKIRRRHALAVPLVPKDPPEVEAPPADHDEEETPLLLTDDDEDDEEKDTARTEEDDTEAPVQASTDQMYFGGGGDDDDDDDEEDDEDQPVNCSRFAMRGALNRRFAKTTRERSTSHLIDPRNGEKKKKKGKKDLFCRGILLQRDAAFALMFFSLTAAYSIPMIFFFGVAFDEHGLRAAMAKKFWSSKSFISAFLALILMGPIHEVAVYCCVMTNSALTTLIAGGFKSTALSTYRALLRADGGATTYDNPWELIGMVVSTLASIVYTHAWWQEQQKKELLRKELDQQNDLVGLRFKQHPPRTLQRRTENNNEPRRRTSLTQHPDRPDDLLLESESPPSGTRDDVGGGDTNNGKPKKKDKDSSADLLEVWQRRASLSGPGSPPFVNVKGNERRRQCQRSSWSHSLDDLEHVIEMPSLPSSSSSSLGTNISHPHPPPSSPVHQLPSPSPLAALPRFTDQNDLVARAIL